MFASILLLITLKSAIVTIYGYISALWATIHQGDRLVVDEPNRLSCYTVEVDIIEKLKRIYYFSKRMSKTVTSEDGDIKCI
jgi:hypothetical protein